MPGPKRAHPVIAAIVLAASIAGQVPGAAAAGDTEAGRRLAEQWCASCHLVTAEQGSATTEAPPFATLARRGESELQRIPLFLTDPHPPMPQLGLSRHEIDDIAAYIRSLRD